MNTRRAVLKKLVWSLPFVPMLSRLVPSKFILRTGPPFNGYITTLYNKKEAIQLATKLRKLSYELEIDLPVVLSY